MKLSFNIYKYGNECDKQLELEKLMKQKWVIDKHYGP